MITTPCAARCTAAANGNVATMIHRAARDERANLTGLAELLAGFMALSFDGERCRELTWAACRGQQQQQHQQRQQSTQWRAAAAVAVAAAVAAKVGLMPPSPVLAL